MTCFFFQAEDGIRDLTVTGVQCALPISFCKKAFPQISDQTVARMVAGIEAEIFRPDEELRRLAHCAVGLGVDSHFKEGATAAQIMESLQRTGESGRAWLAQLEISREPWFNINVGDG